LSASPRSKHGGPRVRFPPPLVFVGFILVGVAARYALPLDARIGWPLRTAAGIAIIGCGLALIVWANRGFIRIGRKPEPWLPSSALILEGPYRFTRNPMYVGMTLIQLGIAAAADNGWIALFTAPSLLVVHFMAVVPEERYLEETFGDSYAALKKQVRRYL
jgi:protein-S-isoprenylcysteine O-methyltransferase Ste14